MVRLILGLAGCAAMAMADVGMRGKDADAFGVQINGKLTKMTTNKDTYPLWSANVAGVDGPLEYKYVQMYEGKIKKEEDGVRHLPEDAAHTPNEFFDRTHTLSKLPPLPQVYENKFEQNSPFFREGYIGNLFVEGDPKEISVMNKGGEGYYPDPVKVNVQYIGANDNIKIEDVIFNLSGQTAREYAKLAYQMKFPKKNRLLDLSTLKLRNEETDATMIREKIYVDILNSLGVPAQQSAYVRLFINNKPIGLFVAVEEMKKHWIKKVLHPGVKKTKPGALWKMNACCGKEGNLEWLGPTTKSYVIDDIYKNILPGKNPEDDLMQDLIKFMKDLKDFDPAKNKDPIAFWEERLDLDLFLKSMAMEYLAGAWDSYWNSGSNFQIYNDPVTGKWTWLPTDFDDTFGTSFEGKIESYREIPKLNDRGFESPLAQKLIMETPEITARFEEILKETVSYVFKPAALTPRLDAYMKMIEKDVAWDRALPRVSKGKSEKFTAEDLPKGMGDGTKGSWGLKKWITKRSELVQKDLEFKAAAGNPTKLPFHVINNVEDAFGIMSVSKAEKGGKADKSVKIPAKNNTSVGKPSVKKGADINRSEEQVAFSANAGKTATAPVDRQSEKKTSSAEGLKGRCYALGSVVVVAVLLAL
ncbi:hypothetical protein BGZ99_004161 [Dissophora globulifera]|uniref:Coth protein-domain-containing protein n=1 Tax=Dissophora globulifera TaxID=979702 RepID=A0A9P6RL60_9FUNG|nr:hypothetical protein BGZ99_004161 [Dissophora globulifera]